MKLTHPKVYQASIAVALMASGMVPVSAQTSVSPTTPYVVPIHPSVQITSIFTVGDSVNLKPDGITPYRMVGIPDGLGAYDNGDGTFSVLMNHEIPMGISGGVAIPVGILRASGNGGAFVSRWTIDKATLNVLKGEDLIPNATSIFLSNNDPFAGIPHTAYLAGGTTPISRLCSADLAAPSAYAWTDPVSGIFYGTAARLFQSGEESGGRATSVSLGSLGLESSVEFGRQFIFVATDDPNIPGDQSGTAYEFPHCGIFAWENNLANPVSQRKTIVVGNDDASPGGQIYVWVGEKQTTGNVVERAGLTKQSSRDNFYVVKVDTATIETTTGATLELRATPLSGTFSLQAEGDVSDKTGVALENLSNSKGGTKFLRPEDGAWDPINPSDYYFVTTDRYDQVKDGVGSQIGRSRLYRMRFTDISKPELGGQIKCLLDGTQGHNMFDNFAIDRHGRILLQEDVGNVSRNGKIWMYLIANGQLILLAQHDTARFGDLTILSTAPFSRDEESSGMIDASEILGDDWFLLDDQAHYSLPGELVEGGQLLAMKVPFVPVLGDLNGDGRLDKKDLAVLNPAIRARSTNPNYDLNKDGRVDAADARWLTLRYTL